ncbi:MAG: hypothetical protein QG594_539, partial [Bacteroidota bacterium]|nr:hypothetical protein [Bacteroidota bacterium]
IPKDYSYKFQIFTHIHSLKMAEIQAKIDLLNNI